MTATATARQSTIGDQLREWRQRRRKSQLDLALDAQVSTRHLSFVETGRAQPSREMVLHLCEQLEVPLRDRNVLLVAAGFAPTFPERALSDPALQVARKAVELVLAGHEPHPALALDRHWNLVAHNAAVGPLLAGIDQRLLSPPVNVLRLSLHPLGLQPRIVNLAEWREHLFARLRKQIELTADQVLIDLHAELQALPMKPRPVAPRAAFLDLGGIAVPLRLQSEAGVLSFLSTTTVFGTPVDVTLSELMLETFFPADDFTASALRAARTTSAPAGR